MKDIFSWRLTPTKPYFSSLWDNALFIFDTSFLLDLYRVSNSSRDDFFKIIEKISNRIWLPYQVANEFFNNREKVIDSEAASYKKALTAVERWAVEQAEFSALKNQISQTGRIVSIELDDFFEKQKNFIDEVQKVAAILKESIENISAAHVATNNPQDHILEKILSFFDSRVGEPYSEKKLKDIYKTCEERYKENIPPGYMDISEKDDERKYNDYIIWHQIIEHAISTKKPIIFITSEKKEDWWLKKGGKIISPRPELRKEFKDLVNTDFWMYQTQHFLNVAKEMLFVEINPRTIEETNAISDAQLNEENITREIESAEKALDINFPADSINHYQSNDSEIRKAAEILRGLKLPTTAIEQLRRDMATQTKATDILKDYQLSNNAFEQLKRDLAAKTQAIEFMREIELSRNAIMAQMEHTMSARSSAIEFLRRHQKSSSPTEQLGLSDVIKDNDVSTAKPDESKQRKIDNAENDNSDDGEA